MAAISGKSGAVTVAAGEVNGIKEWSLSYTHDVLETTDFQSDGVAENIVGKSSWSGSFSGDKDGAPIAGGSIIALVLKESETAGQLWSGNAIINDVAHSTSFDGVTSASYSFTGTGALTVATA